MIPTYVKLTTQKIGNLFQPKDMRVQNTILLVKRLNKIVLFHNRCHESQALYLPYFGRGHLDLQFTLSCCFLKNIFNSGRAVIEKIHSKNWSYFQVFLERASPAFLT